MTEATDSLPIQRVEIALNAKHGITGYLVFSTERGVVSSSFEPSVDQGLLTAWCQSVFTYDKSALKSLSRNCSVQAVLVIPGTGVFHLQHNWRYALVVLIPPSMLVDVEALAQIMAEHIDTLEKQ